MAHTDVHRPGWVKEHDPTMRREFASEHDHRYGPCDLDTSRHAYGNKVTNCRIRYIGGRNIYCGCRMCTGQGGRKYTRRKERAAWRADRQRLLAGIEQRPARKFEAWF